MNFNGLDKEDQKKIIAAAVARLERIKIGDCFDPIDVDSRPTDSQQEIFDGLLKYKHRYIRAGNQSGKCLITGTYVATPNGAVLVEDLEAGDTVYDEFGKEIKVVGKTYQGRQVVLPIQRANQYCAAATADHRWLASSGKEIVTEDLLDKDIQIKTVEYRAEMGQVQEPHAYALGALLGDGCSDSNRRGIIVSSEDERIPNAVAACLSGVEVKKCKGNNYSWEIKSKYNTGSDRKPVNCRHYNSWVGPYKAHQKTADLDVLKTWDRDSLVAFLAGLLDTDGSVQRPSDTRLVLSWGMQAKPVVEAVQWLVLSLWGYQSSLRVDNREKYKNGPVYTFMITDTAKSCSVLKELNKYIVTERKKYNITDENRETTTRTFYHRIRKDRIREADTWDIEVDSPTHLFLLANGMVSHNTQIGAREVSWILQENHPQWTRPEFWKDEPLQILVVGRVSRQVEDSIWRKIKGYLTPGEYKEQRSGGALQKVTHKNGNMIIFASHHAENEAREKLQSYTAHYVWIDEMPSSFKIIEELHQRITARDGYFLATFTPKVKNDEIRKFVDTQEDQEYAQVYRLSKLDNPAYADRQEEIIAQTEGYSEAYRNAVLYGEWLKDDLLVYDFDISTTVVEHIPEYSPAWRHVEAVDPALQSKLGFILLAENPSNKCWYVVKAEYVNGIHVPSEMVKEIQKKVEGYNLVRRTSDVAPWYVNTANAMRVRPAYMTVREKTVRKGDLIKGLQTALGQKLFIASWCTDLIDELGTCAWSETVVDKIINAQSYHLLDALQYGIDILPTPLNKIDAPSRDVFLRQQYEKRINDEYKESQTQKSNKGTRKHFKIARSRKWGR